MPGHLAALLQDEIRGDRQHPRHPPGVLGGEAGDRRRPEDPLGREGQEVGLDPRAGAAIGASDAEGGG